LRRVLLYTLALACAGCAVLAPVAVAQTTVSMTLRDGAIVPSQFTAARGQKVTIHVQNAGRKVHNLVIPAFYIFSYNLQPGQSVTVSFTPDKTGRFPYMSDAGRQREDPEPGMTGTLTVR
jgi:plastocyanin